SAPREASLDHHVLGGLEMRVIDVDSHAEPASNSLDAFPSLKAKLPEKFPDSGPRFRIGGSEMFAFFVSDDLLRDVPVERRMSIDKIMTPAMEMMYSPDRPAGFGYDGATMNPELLDPAARVAWLD